MTTFPEVTCPCTWCGLRRATTDKFGPSCPECATAPRLVRVRRYLQRLKRAAESKEQAA